MKDSFFRSMTWLHTWVGLLVCWILLVVFFAGSMSYFRHEISLWTKPELHSGTFQHYHANELGKQLASGQKFLNERTDNARDWRIYLPTERRPYLSYGWQNQPEAGQRRGEFHELIVKPDSEEMISEVRESKGGNFFYRLHFDLHYIPAKFARWIVGLCTMFMLVALISGIVIHKRIFKDFFSFRRNKRSRSWLDAHNVSSVIALPYHLMITYTGLITLMFMYMPWAIVTNYDGDNQAFRAELNPSRVQTKPSGQDANLISAASLLPQVKRYWGEAPIKQVIISAPHNSNSRISFYRNNEQLVTDKRTQIVFNGVTGELITMSPMEESATHATYDTLMSLHTARFSDFILRLFFFFCGLLGCAMIATGALLWAVKIRQKQQKQINKGEPASFGLRLVEGLNLTFIAGLPLATSVFFYANRILPLEIQDRAQWEADSFFIALGLVGLLACFNRSLSSWRLVLSIGGLGLISLPLLNALTSPSNIIDNIVSGQWALVGFDLLSCLLGLGLLFAIKKLNTSSKPKSAAIKKNTAAESQRQNLASENPLTAKVKEEAL
ncbi:PepSY-associated TM helix domain-containing protein [Shewanella sp. YLB-07]|uniref:PepSY-associated TM helix domain-containing protein n=1 Tax=Shewanella sp. YLB-07 TaxID=2601268 RepID=UPI00128CB618|nr:PepSY-associated TM helix domain-containing protein [Shewanella sp. YLB-07]MPY22540.1 PepSY domain-containing protein [Shewanella sp. YLB-07]